MSKFKEIVLPDGIRMEVQPLVDVDMLVICSNTENKIQAVRTTKFATYIDFKSECDGVVDLDGIVDQFVEYKPDRVIYQKAYCRAGSEYRTYKDLIRLHILEIFAANPPFRTVAYAGKVFDSMASFEEFLNSDEFLNL